jgi:hypothetical protein
MSTINIMNTREAGCEERAGGSRRRRRIAKAMDVILPAGQSGKRLC